MAKKLNYNLYLGENPNPKDTNNIVVQGTVENGKLKSIDSATLNGESLINGGGGGDSDAIPLLFINKGIVLSGITLDSNTPVPFGNLFSENLDIALNALNAVLSRLDAFDPAAQDDWNSHFDYTFIDGSYTVWIGLGFSYNSGWLLSGITISDNAELYYSLEYYDDAPPYVGEVQLTADTLVKRNRMG